MSEAYPLPESSAKPPAADIPAAAQNTPAEGRDPTAWQKLTWLWRDPPPDEVVPGTTRREESAARYERTFAPADCQDIWFTDYAVKACEEAIKNADYVDGKAEKFIGVTGTVAALVTAFITKELASSRSITGAMLPALFCAACGIVLALKAHRPSGQCDLPDIRKAIHLYGSNPELGPRGFAAKLHQARISQRDVVCRKSAFLEVAYAWVVAALLCLALPIAAALIQPPKSERQPVTVNVTAPVSAPVTVNPVIKLPGASKAGP